MVCHTCSKIAIYLLPTLRMCVQDIIHAKNFKYHTWPYWLQKPILNCMLNVIAAKTQLLNIISIQTNLYQGAMLVPQDSYRVLS